jgi:hypothetical protein
MTFPIYPSSPTQRRLLTFWSGGWVLLVAGLLMAGVCAWRVPGMLRSRGSPTIGDGKNVASYGFDLSTCLVSRETLLAAGFAKDGLHALLDPPTLTAAEVEAANTKAHGKFLVPGDRVVGVAWNGETRAYPLRILAWHEVVNDTLAGRPIAVTYSPLCDSVAVFDRRVATETLTFGVSGLLYNSNLLMYDRRPEGRGESLWSPLQFRAVAGPAAAAGWRLEVIPAAVMRWGDWRSRHPETRVLAAAPGMAREYQREPYASYFGSDRLRFPVRPLPPPDGPAYKTRVVVVGVHGVRGVFPLSTIAARADANGVWRTALGGSPLRFIYREPPASVWVETDEPHPALETVYCFWFAWYALHPDEALLP